MAKINKIKKSDFNRVLITETLPYETPIIFSNDGLYDRVVNLESYSDFQKDLLKALIFGAGLPTHVNVTIPYVYKIRKNSTEFRRLVLLHPMSQWLIKGFYERFESLILHYCSVSPASIRSPQAIASSFYNKNSWENVNQYKNASVAISATDRYSKHTPSYFSYRGYDRLYKFFSSVDYFSLEKRFSILMTLDVSKCFDSIYTHCLSWAVKEKQFVKQNLNVGSTFGQEFDSVIRHGNHGETNGIPIGPESSRIFAEIIFQEIDRQVIERLGKNTDFQEFNSQYAFRRYVDDIFIFAKDEKSARSIYECYSDVLLSFNLHANSAKSIKFHRPFLTKKSRLVEEASAATNFFFEKFLEEDRPNSLKPLRINSPWKLTKSYIDVIKALCSHSEVGYDEISSYLISVITERVKKLVNLNAKGAEAANKIDYLNAILVLLEIQYFLYSVAPSVGASYKLSTSVILAHRFFKIRWPDCSPIVSQKIYDLTEALLRDECSRPASELVDGFIHLEALNIVLATRELGESFLLPSKILADLFLRAKDLSYFTIVSCLFYFRDSAQYADLRNDILVKISNKLGDLSDVFSDSEKAYLLLDSLSCPYISNKAKGGWIRAIHKLMGKGVITKVKLTEFLASATSSLWQVNWSEADLLNSLEKKELKQAY